MAPLLSWILILLKIQLMSTPYNVLTVAELIAILAKFEPTLTVEIAFGNEQVALVEEMVAISSFKNSEYLCIGI